MISVCLILKNEELFIRDCLESIKEIASEIIVVDNGCVDRTMHICNEYGCKIINSPNSELDIGRDLYLKEAKYPCILTIDADERMEMIEKSKLYSILNNTNEDVLAYNLRSFQYLGNGKWADAELIRLFRNDKNIHYNGSSIHATLEPSILKQGGKIETLDWYMHHVDILYLNRTSKKRDGYVNKLLLQLNKEEFKNNDRNSYYLYHIFLGMEYVAQKNYIKAKKCFDEAANNENMFSDYAIDSLCRMYILQGKYELIPDLIDLEKTVFVKDIDFYDKIDIMGNVFLKRNKNLAIALYEKAIRENIARPSDYINLAYLLKDTNREQAKKYMQIALEKNSYLRNDMIYGPGDEPNMFSQVSCFLVEINNVKDLLDELF